MNARMASPFVLAFDITLLFYLTFFGLHRLIKGRKVASLPLPELIDRE